MIAISESACYQRQCKHFKGVKQPDGTELTERLYCTAFPNGIPYEIIDGINKHLTPVKGQANNIVFTKKEKD